VTRIVRKTLKRCGHNWGYVRIKVDGQWMLEHRHVMELAIGRKLKRSETVHHKDENKQNNRIGNLELKDNAQHVKEHRAEDFTKANVQLRCAVCGNPFFIRKDRHSCMQASGQQRFFCSRVCVNAALSAGIV
jgi:hypothetical protein